MTTKGFLTALGIAGVCALIAIGFLIFYTHEMAFATAASLSDFPGYKATTVEIDGQEINAAIADTSALQELGLGNRTGLPDGEGMLFVFSVDKPYAFWMKDMHFSIDMVWISSAGDIIYMAQNISPDTYPEDFVPPSPARYVLELPANYAAEHDFKIGDSVHL
jgi:uncharacterized protein